MVIRLPSALLAPVLLALALLSCSSPPPEGLVGTWVLDTAVLAKLETFASLSPEQRKAAVAFAARSLAETRLVFEPERARFVAGDTSREGRYRVSRLKDGRLRIALGGEHGIDLYLSGDRLTLHTGGRTIPLKRAPQGSALSDR